MDDKVFLEKLPFLWRYSSKLRNFFSRHPNLWRIVRYGKLNVNTETYWDKRFKVNNYSLPDEKPLRDFICSQVKKTQSVLDVGCGDGIILKSLKKSKSKNIFGLDISKVAIANLKKAGIDGKVSKLPQIHVSENSYDVVICTEVLEHIPNDAKTVDNMLQVLKPSGMLFVSVPNNCLGPDVEPEHLRKYTRDDLKRLLKDLKNLRFKVFEPRILAYGYKK